MAIKSFVLNEDTRKLLQGLHTALFKKYGKSFYEEYVESSVCIKIDDPSKVLLNVTFTYNDETEKEKFFKELKTDIEKMIGLAGLSDYFDDLVIIEQYSPQSRC